MIFFLNFTKYSTHHSLSPNTGFKSLAFILFEILHLQNCDVKFQNFQRAITKKKSYEFFLKVHHIQYSPGVFSPARSPPRTIFLSPPPPPPPRIRAPVRSQSHRGIILFRRGSAVDPRWSPKIPVLFHRGGLTMSYDDVIIIDS